MINQNYLCVFDFETGSLATLDPVPLELAAVMVDPRTLERVPGSTFNTLIKPALGWEAVTAEALDINKITKEQVDAEGLEEKVAFDAFVGFVKKFSKTANKWNMPIQCGHNIAKFDIPIMDSLCRRHGYVDKDGFPKLFHPFNILDSISICLMWFENLPEPEKYGLDKLREFFGIPKEGAHRALKDVEDTADIICRFLQFHRTINSKGKPKFKNCFAKS